MNKNDCLLNRAKKLRYEMTPQERKLWYEFLRNYPLKFYRQRVIGVYIVDFYCAKVKLIIEVDGGQHYEENNQAEDKMRTEELEARGLTVMRFSNYEVNMEFDAVCKQIDNYIQERFSRLPV